MESGSGIVLLDMSLVMVVHALTGTVTVCAGALALMSGKGSLVHRFSGRVFVGSTLLMGLIVAAGVWFEPGSISSLGILFVCFIIYLVVSAWSTVGRLQRFLIPLNFAAPVVALCISIVGLKMGIDAVSNLSVAADIPPREAYFFFSALAFIAMLLDINNLRLNGVRGKHRIVRHVWRMTCALFFATSTLFTGPGSIVFPETLRGSLLLAVPQFVVVILSLFWVCKLLFFKSQLNSHTLKG